MKQKHFANWIIILSQVSILIRVKEGQTYSFHLNKILFGPLFTVQIHVAPLNYGLKGVPHGNLDILVVTSVSNTQMGILVIDGVPDQVLLTGSTKTEDSFDSLGSGEYACCGYM